MKSFLLALFLPLVALAQPSYGPYPVPGGGGGGTQTNINLNTIVGGGLDGQVVLRSPGGTLVVTNAGTFLGYGALTNQNAFILDGDSRAKSDNGGATTIQAALTNSYLVGSQWTFITNNGLGGQLCSDTVIAWPAFINNYKTFTASGSGTNVVVIDLAGINDIVAFASGTTVGSNYSRLMWLQKQSNCVVVAVGISPAFGLTDSQMGALKVANDIIFASSNWTYYVPAHLLVPPPPKSGMWADNIHNNTAGNDRIAAYVNYAFLAGQYNRTWFYGFLDTPSAQSTGSAVDSTGQGSSVFGVGGTPSLHLAHSSGNNAFGITPFGDTEYFEWNSASGTLALAGNIKFALTPSNTVFSQGVTSTVSNKLAPVAITFPNTTVNWTNPVNCTIQLYINNSAITGTAIKKNGTTIFTVLTGTSTINLQVGEYFSETYTVGTPTATWSPAL